LEDRTLLSPGDLDPTFGNGGLVTTIPYPGARGGGAADVAVQSDGRLVVAGGATLDSSSSAFALARYATDGTLDPSFGTGGLITTTFPGYQAASANRLVVQPDGRIVVAGSVGNTGSVVYALARYNSDGTLDTSFGTAGRITLSRGWPGPSGLAVEPDGRILVAGSTTPGYASQFALVRYNSDGTLDSSFGTGGIVTTSFPGFRSALAYCMTLQPDGSIVVAGGVAPPGSAARFAVARYTSDGHLDSSFGTGGLATASFGATFDEHATSVAVLADGRILTSGFTFSTTGRFALAQFGSDGRLDNSFGTGGQVTTSFPGFQSAEAYGMAVQSNGRILVSGGPYNGSGYERFGLVRYNSDGGLDNTFGTAGLVTTDFGGTYALGVDVVIQSDGRIVVAGSSSGPSGSNERFSLARYEGDPVATHFEVSAPAEVTAGQPFDVTVTAADDNGDVVPDYTGTVTLTSTDPLAPTLGSHTFTTADGGVYTFSAVQLFTAGPQSLFANDGNLNGQADLTVDPGAAVAIVLSGPDHAVAGQPFVVTVTAVDAWGNVATGYRGTVWLEATDPNAGLPDAWDFTADDAGTHDFTVTLNTPGPVRLTAHDSDAGWDANLDLVVV
jgi:uncharacterized delta-60 repeat protein